MKDYWLNFNYSFCIGQCEINFVLSRSRKMPLRRYSRVMKKFLLSIEHCPDCQKCNRRSIKSEKKWNWTRNVSIFLLWCQSFLNIHKEEKIFDSDETLYAPYKMFFPRLKTLGKNEAELLQYYYFVVFWIVTNDS